MIDRIFNPIENSSQIVYSIENKHLHIWVLPHGPAHVNRRIYGYLGIPGCISTIAYYQRKVKEGKNKLSVINGVGINS